MKETKKVLISVFNKKNIKYFAHALHKKGFSILATQGTSNLLKKIKIPIIEISNYINFPEIMGGRIKTLHPKIHAGILRRNKQDEEVLSKYNIEKIDIVVVNLYPFVEKVSKSNSLENIIENIDIGGLALLRSAAKNYQNTSVVFDIMDYENIIFELDKYNNIRLKTRLILAQKAFSFTSSYDKKISDYFNSLILNSKKKFSKEKNIIFPKKLNIKLTKKFDIKYGENFHQKAAFYIHKTKYSDFLKKIQGKNLSYNNIVDIDTALDCISEFKNSACVIIKHANPCGVAVSNSTLESYKLAYNSDSISAFGGIIAFNKKVDLETAKCILDYQFVEIIIAPDVEKKALKIFSSKPKIRILVYDYLQYTKEKNKNFIYKDVNGGILLQSKNNHMLNPKEMSVVSIKKPDKKMLKDALFSWKVVKYVKSNAIVYVKNHVTLSIGAGQSSRIDATKIANLKIKEKYPHIKNFVMASDAFLPFRDNVDLAFEAGVNCIIQPGGSIRDSEVIKAANIYNIVMIFTKIRHFRH